MGFRILSRGPVETETGGQTESTAPEAEADQAPAQDHGAPASGSELTDDELFDVLRNSRRRDVLSYLLAEGPTATVTELTEHIASAEYEVPAGELTTTQRKRVYTALYQCHLARLDEFGVVAFDRDEKTVTLRDRADQVAPYLGSDGSEGAATFELGAAAVVATVVALGVAGVGPLGAVSTTAWATVTVVALAGFGLLQLHVDGVRPGA